MAGPGPGRHGPPPRHPRPRRTEPGEFDERTGALLRLAGFPVETPRLDLWRAPTDNDRPETTSPSTATGPLQLAPRRPAPAAAPARRLGPGGGTLTVRTRVGPAAVDFAFAVTYRWTVDGDSVHLAVEGEPIGEWPVTLPRLGLRMAVPAVLCTVEWFGGGPGEAYPDTRAAARVGRFVRTVEQLQTPYVFPQENGARVDVRWAR